MHSLWFMGKRIINAAFVAKALSDPQNARPSLEIDGFVLGLVSELMAEAAPKISAAIQDAAPSTAGRTLEPFSATLEVSDGIVKQNEFVDLMPLVSLLSSSIAKSKTSRFDAIADRARSRSTKGPSQLTC